ncbi:putative DNA primase/helicase [Inhella inkyongensis]|uniref:Putative DNA primase/helicase n=1 Tax=Inhella inkyongensis TaxID=392593 RepID=A0A840RY24_9BURK|nr:DUF3631 domain-containing protein [Inhella inkyongensis]MBB5202845.1 putative DNA primase/helicase [Inhella inkyongensis]
MMAKQNAPNNGRDLIDEILSENDPTPCLNPISPGLLLGHLVELLMRYIVMSYHDAVTMALWIIHAYCYRYFEYSPLLIINAPERACGKSVALGLVAKLVPRPLECANITLAALFRVIQNRSPTVLIDEGDTFLDGKSELAGILNKGYEQGGVVLRVETVGDKMVETAYRVFGPKAIAGISLERHLPDATMSRGIQIAMRRKVKGEQVDRLRGANPSGFRALHSQMGRFVQDHEMQLQRGFAALPDELSDREQDNWEPLFTIAACMGAPFVEITRKAALSGKAMTQEPHSVTNNLLSDVREVLQGHEHQYVTTALLIEKLTGDEDLAWKTYNKGFPLTPRQLARNLQPYGIRPKTVRMGPLDTPKGYEVRDFRDAFERYLKPLGEPEAAMPMDAASSVAFTEEELALLRPVQPLGQLAPLGKAGQGSAEFPG